jgi:hypothetical protein
MIPNPDDPDLSPVQELQIVERRVEDMLGHRKLQVETRLKLLAKWDPRRYGDALKLSGDPEAPLAGLTDAQLDERLAVLLAKRGEACPIASSWAASPASTHPATIVRECTMVAWCAANRAVWWWSSTARYRLAARSRP